MAKFKVGDKVKHSYIGAVYRVSKVRDFDGKVLFENYEDAGYFDTWFYDLVEEKPVLDLSKPVTTRDGRKVRIICTDRKWRAPFPIVALVEGKGGEILQAYTSAGKYLLSGNCSEEDLINPPVKKYINLFQKDVSRMYYDTREEAEKAGNGSKLAGYVKTIEVEL